MPIEDWYKQLPPVTRTYVTLCILTTAACALELIAPFNIYYNARLIFQKGEAWRLLTCFLYFGSLNLDFVFHMFFLVKYAKSLEETSFRNRPADFVWMLLLGGAVLAAAAPLAGVQFLGSSLAFMMVYVWSRRNRHVSMSLLGVLTFSAPYLPWVLLALSLLVRSSAAVDLLGMAAGHLYYFLEDVYPRMAGGRRPLATPAPLAALFNARRGGGGAAAAPRVEAAGRRVHVE